MSETALNKKDPNKIVLEPLKPKRRHGVLPTRRERDRSKAIPREEKHKRTQDDLA